MCIVALRNDSFMVSLIIKYLLQSVYVKINHIMTTAHALCEAGHFAAQAIRQQANRLDKDWRTFATALEDRTNVLNLAVIFHQKAQDVSVF